MVVEFVDEEALGKMIRDDGPLGNDPPWATVLLSILTLAVILAVAVVAARTFAPRLELPAMPNLAGLIAGPDPQKARTLQAVQGPATDLERAMTVVRGNSQELSTMLRRAQDKLATEMSIVDGMRALVQEMKRDASQRPSNSAQMATLAAKRQSFELTYTSLQAARDGLDATAKDVETRLASMQTDVTIAQDSAQRLAQALDANPGAAAPRPYPGDEQPVIADYLAAADSARREISAMRNSEADLLKAASGLRDESAAAAELRTPQGPSTAPPPAVAQAIPAPAITPTPTPAPVPTATPRPAGADRPEGATPQATPRPTATPRPARAPTSRWQFTLGFKALADQIPDVVGQPLENARVDPKTGDIVQATTTGMMYWKKSANLTYFTDGSTTWVVGPNGLQSRPNGETFDWEGRTPAPAPTPTPARR